jgi:hypothetical protein
MTKNQLLEIAPDLSDVSSKSKNELFGKMDALIAEMNDTMAKRTDIESLVGKDNLQMMKDNHSNHLRFVYALLDQYDKQVLLDTVTWVYRSYRSRGFHIHYWAAQINTWITIFKNYLSNETFEDIYPLYNWFSITIPHFSKISDTDLNGKEPTISFV